MKNSNSNQISSNSLELAAQSKLDSTESSKQLAVGQHGMIQPIFDLLDEAPPYQRLAVKTLALIHQHQIDPLPVLEGLAFELPRSARSEIWKLIAKYEPGDSLLEHLQQTRDVLPDGLVQALILADQNGYLSTVYVKILLRGPQLDERIPRGRSSVGFFGPVQKSVFIVIVIIYFLIKIIPELTEILEEFELQQSLSYTMLEPLAYWVKSSRFYLLAPVTILSVFLILLFILLFGSILTFVFRFRSVLGFFRRFSPTQWSIRSIPKSITRRRTLALLILAGHSIEEGILGIRSSKSIRAVFSSFERIKDRIKHQADSWQTLRRFRQISAKEATILPLCSPQAQAWLLRWNANHVSESREFNRIFRSRGLLGIIQLLLMIVVFFTCLFVFLALIEMMVFLS